jgi:hypothetical protein
MTTVVVVLEVLAIAGFALVMALARRAGLHRGARSDLRWREAHHAYLGWILVALSFQWGGWWCRIPGLVLSLDDLLQHAVQLVTRRLTWQSPIARGNAWLYRVSRVWRWLTGLADRVFD